MKRILSCLSLTLCIVLVTVFLAACGSGTKWLRPDFTYEGEELTIEFVNNSEKDFKFPIEGLKFNHSRFTDENILEYCWVIYNVEHELVGWIEAGNGYDVNKSGRFKYGFGTSTNNGVYGYTDTIFCVVLKSTDLTIFDRLKITSDYGSVEFITEMDNNPVRGSKRYFHIDEATNKETPAAGSEKFVCGLYTLKLADIDPKKTETINITLSLKAE